ncbi:MAG TPA: hypothetical protein VHD56_17570 [Tepidisphaeraceae bacterium]|nr:hypothetical protein [Tepidisphaeraceae bacterium]
MTKQTRQPSILDAPPLKQMPPLSPEAAAVIHAHLPPPNVEQYIAPTVVATHEVAHSSAHSEKAKEDTVLKRAEWKP